MKAQHYVLMVTTYGIIIHYYLCAIYNIKEGQKIHIKEHFCMLTIFFLLRTPKPKSFMNSRGSVENKT